MTPAVSSALQGMMHSMRRMELAAARIAGAGSLSDSTVDPSGAGRTPAVADEYAGPMVDVMMAQRAFSAQLHVLKAGDEMNQEAVNLGRR
jgi:flagellar hook protein FlgE